MYQDLAGHCAGKNQTPRVPWELSEFREMRGVFFHGRQRSDIAALADALEVTS
jgi:hypothetical protein